MDEVRGSRVMVATLAGRWSAVPSPLGVVGNVSFVIVAMATTAIMGWLVESGALPILDRTPFVLGLPGWGGTLFATWMAIVAVGALVLPTVALVIWGRYASVRRALLAYVLVLVSQILIEIVL